MLPSLFPMGPCKNDNSAFSVTDPKHQMHARLGASVGHTPAAPGNSSRTRSIGLRCLEFIVETMGVVN